MKKKQSTVVVVVVGFSIYLYWLRFFWLRVLVFSLK